MECDLLSRVSLTPGGTTEQEGHLTVGDRLLGQIVKHNKSMLSRVAEMLCH